jgi:IPT/TIG domain
VGQERRLRLVAVFGVDYGVDVGVRRCSRPTFWVTQLEEGTGMRSGRLVWWRLPVLGLAGRVGGRGRRLRCQRLVRRLRGPVAVLAAVPLLSLGLAGVSLVAGGAGVAEAASAAGAGSVTIYAGLSEPEGITAGPDGNLWFTNDNGNSIGRITTAVTPEISGFTPGSGAAGTTVTLTGQNLSAATAVAFGGTPAAIVSATATQILTTVSAGAATGPITVATPAGTATSHTSFTVT